MQSLWMTHVFHLGDKKRERLPAGIRHSSHKWAPSCCPCECLAWKEPWVYTWVTGLSPSFHVFRFKDEDPSGRASKLCLSRGKQLSKYELHS